MRWLILVVFVSIIGSLVAAGVFLVRDKGRTRNVVRALTVRITLSVSLFAVLLLAWRMGWIEAHGVIAQ